MNSNKSLFTLTRLDYKTNKDSYNNVDSPESLDTSKGTFSQKMTFDTPKMYGDNETKKVTQGYEAHLRPPKTQLKPEAEAMLKGIQKQSYEEVYKKFCMVYMLDNDVADAKWRLGEATGEIEPIHIFRDDQGKVVWPNQFTPVSGKLITRSLGEVSLGNKMQTVPLLGLPPYTKIIDEDDGNEAGYSLNKGTTSDMISIRKPGFKQINEVVNVLQSFESKIIGTIPTYLNEWDLSMYIQENIAEVNQNNGKNWLSWPTHLFYRIEKDNPLEGSPSPNVRNAPVPKTDPMHFMAYANMNAAVSAIYRDYAPHGTMNEIFHPEAFPLSKWWVNPISTTLDQLRNVSELWKYQSGKAYRVNSGSYEARVKAIGTRLVETDITDINQVLISPREYTRFMDEMCEALSAYNITDETGNVKSDPLYDIPFYHIFYDSPSEGTSDLERIYEGLSEQQVSRSDLMRDILLTLAMENQPFFDSLGFDPDEEGPKISTSSNSDPVRDVQTQYANESSQRIKGIPIAGGALLKMFLKRGSSQSNAEAAGRDAKQDASSKYSALAQIDDIDQIGNDASSDPTSGTSMMEGEEHKLDSEDLVFSYGTGAGMLQYSPFLFGGPHSRCDDPYSMMGYLNHSNNNARHLFRAPSNEDKLGYLNYKLTDYASGQEDANNTHQYTYTEFPNYSPLPMYCGDVRNTDHSSEMFQKGYFGSVRIPSKEFYKITGFTPTNGGYYGSYVKAMIDKPGADLIYGLLSMPGLKLTLKPKSDNSQDRTIMFQHQTYDSRSMYDLAHKNFDSLGTIDKFTDRRLKEWFDGFMISRCGNLVPVYMSENSSWKGNLGHNYVQGFEYNYEVDYTLGRTREYHYENGRLYYEEMITDKKSDDYGEVVEKDVSGSYTLRDEPYKEDKTLNKFDGDVLEQYRDGYHTGDFVKQSEGLYYKVAGRYYSPPGSAEDEFTGIANEAITNVPQDFKAVRSIMSYDPNNQFVGGHIDSVVALSRCYNRGRTGSGAWGHGAHLWRWHSNWGPWVYDDEELLSTYILNSSQARWKASKYEQKGHYGARQTDSDDVRKPSWSTVRYIDPEFHKMLKDLYEGGIGGKKFTVTFKFGGGKEAPVLLSLNLHIKKESHNDTAFPVEWNHQAPYYYYYNCCGCHYGWWVGYPYKPGTRYVFGRADLYYLVAEWDDIKDMRVNISKFFDDEDVIEMNKGGKDYNEWVEFCRSRNMKMDFIDEYSFENYKSGYIYSIFNPWNTKDYNPSKYMSPMKRIWNVETIYGTTAWGFDIQKDLTFFTSIDYIARYGKSYKIIGDARNLNYSYNYLGPTACFTDHLQRSFWGVVLGASLMSSGYGAYVGGAVMKSFSSIHCSSLGWDNGPGGWWGWLLRWYKSLDYNHSHRREYFTARVQPETDLLKSGTAGEVDVSFDQLIERGTKDICFWIWQQPGIMWAVDAAGGVKLSIFKNYKKLARDVLMAQLQTRTDVLNAFKDAYGDITPRTLITTGATVIDPKIWYGSIDPTRFQVDLTKLKDKNYRDNLYYDPLIEYFYHHIFKGGWADVPVSTLIDTDIDFLQQMIDQELADNTIEKDAMPFISDLKCAYNVPLFDNSSNTALLDLYIMFYLRVLYYWRRYFLFKRMNKTDGTFHNMMHMEKIMEYSEKAKHQQKEGPDDLEPYQLSPLPVSFFDIQNSLNDKLETLANIETTGQALERDYATVVYVKVQYVRSLEINTAKNTTWGWDVTQDSNFTSDPDFPDNPNRALFKSYPIQYIPEVGRWALIPKEGNWRLVSKEYNEIYDKLVAMVDEAPYEWKAPIETIKAAVFKANGDDAAEVAYQKIETEITETWNIQKISKTRAKEAVYSKTYERFLYPDWDGVSSSKGLAIGEKEATRLYNQFVLGCKVYDEVETIKNTSIDNPNLTMSYASARELLTTMIEGGELNDYDRAKEEENLKKLEDSYNEMLAKAVRDYTYEWYIVWDPYKMTCNGMESIDEHQADSMLVRDLVAAKNRKDTSNKPVVASISFDIADSLAISNILTNTQVYQDDDLQQMSCFGIDRNDYWHIKVPKESNGKQIKPQIDIMQNDVFIRYMDPEVERTLEDIVLGKMSRTLSPVRVMSMDSFQPPALQSIKAFDAL